MSSQRDPVIDAHPDPDPARFVHALGRRVPQGCKRAPTRLIRLADLVLAPAQRARLDGRRTASAIAKAQKTSPGRAHRVSLPAVAGRTCWPCSRGFLEQVMRPGFALRYRGRYPKKLLKGPLGPYRRNDGCPAFFYRLYYPRTASGEPRAQHPAVRRNDGNRRVHRRPRAINQIKREALAQGMEDRASCPAPGTRVRGASWKAT